MTEHNKDSNQEVKDHEVKFRKLRDVIVWISNHRFSTRVIKIAVIFLIWLLSSIGYIKYANIYFCGYEKWKEILELYPSVIYNLLLLHTTIVIMLASLSGLLSHIKNASDIGKSFYVENWIVDTNIVFTFLIIAMGLVLFINSSDIFKEIIEIATQDYNWIKQ